MNKVHCSLWILSLLMLFGCRYEEPIERNVNERMTRAEYQRSFEEILTFMGFGMQDTVNLDVKLILSEEDVEKCSYKDGVKAYFEMKKNSEMNYPLPIFKDVDSNRVVVIANGKGLWGSIWGMILLDSQTMKIIKVSFDHEGEMPDQNGDITDTKFEDRFIGLDYFTEVLEVDGISGATKTSRGMILAVDESAKLYEKGLSSLEKTIN